MPKAKAKANTKEKRNWKHIHKVRVHDNRWLIWTIAITVLVFSSVIAYIQVTGIDFDVQMNSTSSTPGGWTTFRNASEGYNLKYPREWGVESEGQSRMSFVDPQNPNEYFSVSTYPIADARQVKDSLVLNGNEEEVSIAGVKASYFVPTIETAEKVAYVTEDELVYVLRGKGKLFSRIVESFRFNQEIE